MSGDLQISAQAASALSNAAIAKPASTKNAAAAQKAAKDFEAVFLNEMLGSMFSGVSAGPFGGGAGEDMFRSLMTDQYAHAIAAQGGVGLADAVQRELMTMQERSHGAH
jgi:Rod binding domain-containing protein